MENLVTELQRAYSGKRVLVTGHNGFKGTWLVALLNLLGAQVHGISLSIDPSSPFKEFHENGEHRSYVQDITDFEGLKQLVVEIDPEIIFHLAAQALVLDSYENPLATFGVNVQGTANVLESVISASPLGVVVATTDKVYRNDNSGKAFRENDVLWGHDPYSLSKTGTELVVSAWRVHPRIGACKLVSVRAGNVIGAGDRSKNRLMPDLIRAVKTDRQFLLRNPNSVRPWQYVIDPLIGYLIVGQRIILGLDTSPSFNFGPKPDSCISVSDFVEMFLSYHPLHIKLSATANMKESGLLLLDSSLATQELRWESNTALSEAIIQTMKLELTDFSVERIYSHVTDFLTNCI